MDANTRKACLCEEEEKNMKRLIFVAFFILTLAIGSRAFVRVAEAALTSYNITATWYEPETQPRDSIFKGTFDYDSVTHTVSNLKGFLSESMTGTNASDMVWIPLNYQLANGDAAHTYTWHDAMLGGTFAATFFNNDYKTFWTATGGDGWSPQAGVDVGGVYYGFPNPANNPGNAYALIFVPDNPLAALTQAQIDRLAYADFRPLVGPGGIDGGGMMGAVGMTGVMFRGMGPNGTNIVGTMGGYPVSQVITAPTVTLPLSSGWNFISTPIDPAYPTMGTALNDISPNVRIVWGYDNQNKRWLRYDPKAQNSELNTLESGKGYWIYMDSSANLTVAGFDASPTTSLHAGWNLVGYNGADNKDAGLSLTTISGTWNVIWCWDRGLWYGKHETITSFPSPIEPLSVMQRGKAYWIKVKGETEWSN
jgi:hypothetical protein